MIRLFEPHSARKYHMGRQKCPCQPDLADESSRHLNASDDLVDTLLYAFHVAFKRQRVIDNDDER